MAETSDYWKEAFSRRLSRRRLLRAVAVGSASMAGMYVLGCQEGQPRAEPSSGGKVEPKQGGILRIGRSQSPPHLDPALSSSFETVAVHANTHSRLLRPDCGPGKPFGTAKLVPELAEMWEQPDETTYVFYLRKGVKFHDKPPVNGRELTADDVKYTFERLTDKITASPNAQLYSLLEKIEVPDKYSVKMKVKEPYVPFLNYLSHYYSSWIIPKEAVEKFGDLKRNAIGTGPFVLESYERNVKAVFKRNPEYFLKGLPHLDGVEYFYIPDQSTRTTGFRSGDLDLVVPLYSELEAVKSAISGVRIEKQLPGLQAALILQVPKPPFNDKKVRQAIKYAVDLQKIIDVVYSGEAVWGSAVPPVFADWALPQYELKSLWQQDVGKAKQLMAEAGYADGFKTTLYTTPVYGQAYVDMAELIAERLREIKIDVSLQSKEYAAHLQAWQEGSFDMYVGPKTISTEVDEYLYAGYHTKGARNWSRGSDALLNSLLQRQRTAFREEERLKIVKDIQRLLADLAFDIPLPSAYAFDAIPPYVKDYQGSVDYGVPVLMHVWLDK